LGWKTGGPKERAGLEANGPAGKKKKRGRGGPLGWKEGKKGKEGLGFFQHTTNETNPTKINATHIHLFYFILFIKTINWFFLYTKFPVKRIIVGKILNYEKIVD
jgi:hypothetical protein